MSFARLCSKLGLEVPDIDFTPQNLSDLALNSDQYVVPIFASFKDWALPIVSCWIEKNDNVGFIFVNLVRLAPLIPTIDFLIEHFVAMHRSCLVRSNINTLQSLAKLFIHDHARFSHYFRAEEFRKLAGASEDLRLRSWALVCLGLWMQMGEKKISEWLNEYCKTVLTDIEFTDVLQWAQSTHKDRQIFQDAEQQEVNCGLHFKSPLVIEICGTYVPRMGGNNINAIKCVETESFVTNIQNSVKKLLLNRPLLLIGEAGSGKTTIVEYLHCRLRSTELVRIHLGDQTDSKSLIGNYTSSQLGTFEWMPGALTVAVQQGNWVLIENIDRAPDEIVAVLLSLITRRELVIPSRNQVIRAAPGFQIIGTTSQRNTQVIGDRNFAKVELQSPTNDDLVKMIFESKPFLTERVAQIFVTVFRRVEEWQDSQKLVRKATTRDLMKLINRITPKYSAEDMFREAVTCFTSFLSDPMPLSRVIGGAMDILDSQVYLLIQRNHPQLELSDDILHLGRASVFRRKVTSYAARNSDLDLNSTYFELTQPVLKLMEEVTLAVQHIEPVLLVGETGTGKTSVIQYLAKACRRKLVVINVSQQVEAADLVGGFKPVDVRQLSVPLLEEFNEIFDSTFNRAKNHQFIVVLNKIVAKQQWKNVVKMLREAVKMANKSCDNSGSQPKRVRKNNDWSQFSLKIDAFESRIDVVQKSAQFHFIEGLLVRALRQGHWVLLDELNLAPDDTIEGISELLTSRRLTLLENGGQVVHANADFRVFANMNPATDVGKRDLPLSVRQKFTEIWYPSPDSNIEALRAIVARYLPVGTDLVLINDVSELYSTARDLALSHQLVDGAGQVPHFSIRTLSRMLVSANTISSIYGLRRSLFESFSMCFLTLLDDSSIKTLRDHAIAKLLSKIPNQKSVMSQIPLAPSPKHIQFQHWWMPCSTTGQPKDDPNYILTPSVERNLLNLVRATALRTYPVLIQGPTSSGKTSMISYLAKRSGHKVVRINNHEHTDLAEYMGSYESNSAGQLVFKEGALISALKNGYWLILDELNLAPTDVLEALNRLLDENRELLVPETQEVVKPHPDFVLFATQNPPGIYGGRKILSRAFRNRFLELHFGDLPEEELEQIVRDRTGIAPSYAAKIVEVYRELARQRIQRVFEQSVTLRDLFRWAKRPAIGYEQLAFNGYALLAERCRTFQDKEAVKDIIEKVMRVSVNIDIASLANTEIMEAAPSNIVWTRAMRRVLALVEMALQQNEPILLIGETGCGKTTIIQTIAAAQKKNLLILNAHQNTETGDLIGSQRPVRSSSSTKLFEWVDGPLVTALRQNQFFLLDEISLADDSVLERLNPVLETERTLFVPEIGSLSASTGFQFFATMNPGGDYGKKELSPALRNRFTEIWVPTVDDENDLYMIVEQRLSQHCVDSAAKIIVGFSQWLNQNFHLVSLRDILSWVEFVNATDGSLNNVIHGAKMVFIDGLEIRTTLHSFSKMREECWNKLNELTGINLKNSTDNCDIVYGDEIRIGGFPLPAYYGASLDKDSIFNLAAPTSSLNAMRVARAMQVRKPVLLEGSPGAGKTSLITALAQICGAKLTRINLSDQTDLSDLFGQDVPLEEPGMFSWRIAPFLRAMQKGEWVLLDEMNLAPQPVLEGLNACLDHRGEAYIPELDRSFTKHPNFTVFAAQNPQGQGGGRKGLPKSFLNRFSIVYVNQLGLNDLHAIAAFTHPKVPQNIREKLAEYVEELANWVSSFHLIGGPFEFNLRDTLRWLDLISETNLSAQHFLPMIVLQRLRTNADREKAQKMFDKYFGPLETNCINPISIKTCDLRIGQVTFNRTDLWRVHDKLSILPAQIPILEIALQCIAQSWPLILVGPSGSGKSSVIKILANLCGFPLREFAMTADIDSTDLLGEFDQLELESEKQHMWSVLDDEIGRISNIEDAAFCDAVKDRDLDLVKSYLDKKLYPKSFEAIEKFESIDFSKPLFKWVDGLLVKAVEQGDWLVLDNANLCSAAVLDRLNSLLERGGSLLINECAEPDGSPRKIIPHPNFRLFLTVDPKHGELSRAMRNRGVEIWLNGEPSLANEIATELPLNFSQPLTVARLADLKSSSWIRALLVDESCPIKVIREIDSQLAQFIQLNCKWSNFDELWNSWTRFELQCLTASAVRQVRSGESDDRLLTLSAMRRLRDSVYCDFDVYGLLEYSQSLSLVNQEFWSMLISLSQVTDPSRVPVFRDWLMKFCDKADLSKMCDSKRLRSMVSSTLGRQYDFKEGGDGMEQLWQKFGRFHGFANKKAHEQFLKEKSLTENFDQEVRNLGPDHSAQIAKIRILLCQTNGIDDEIVLALEQFRNSVQGTNGKPTVLINQFRELFNIVALSYLVNPTRELFIKLSELSVKAQISTETVKSLMGDALNAPQLTYPLAIESIACEILKSTQFGAATDEIDDFTKFLIDFAPEIVQMVDECDATRIFASKLSTIIRKELPDLQFAREITVPSALEFAKELLYRYVCPLPLDPAISQHVWYDRFIKSREQLQEDAHCWELMQLQVGSDSSALSTWLNNRLVKEQPVPDIWRPEKSSIGIVHRDILAAFNLVTQADTSSNSPDSLQLMLQNATHLSSRLARATEYADLVAPVRTALAVFILHLSYLQRNSNSSVHPSLQLVNPIALLNGLKGTGDTGHTLLEMESMLSSSTTDWKDRFCRLVKVVHQTWSLERLKLEEQKREQLSGVRYLDDSGDDIVEKQFRMIFPDYDHIPDIPEQQDRFLPEFVELFCKLMDPNHGKLSLIDVLVKNANSISKSDDLKDLGSQNSTKLSLPAFLLALNSRAKSYSFKTSVTTLNFYSDPNRTEALHSVQYAEKLQHSIGKLLEKWPENDTLQTIARCAQEIITLPPSSSTAFHLSKIEQIYHNLYEWDRFASKEYKVTDLMASASSLIVKWRQLELATWPALFTAEKVKAAELSAPFWFHLYETLIFAPSDDLGNTAKALVLFMSESSVGQFAQRLRLLYAFENFTENHRVKGCIRNIRQYFGQFSVNVELKVRTIEEQLRKQANDLVKLASFRDTNIHALKQSAKRSHRQLFKCVCKFRELLQTKAINEHAPDGIKLDPKGVHSSKIPENNGFQGKLQGSWVDLITELAEDDIMKSLPSHLRDLQKITTSISNYTQSVKVNNITSMLDFAIEVENHAARLRTETPKVWCKENKRDISALKVEKQQLLTSTLRELRNAGLKTGVNRSTIEDQLELTRVLAISPNLELTRFGNSDSYWMALIEILPRLRAAVSEAPTLEACDVSTQDLNRGMAFLEDSFNQVLKLRRIAAEHSVNIPESMDAIIDLANKPVDCSLPSASEDVNIVSNQLESVAELFEEVLHVTQTSNNAPMKLREMAAASAAITSLTSRTLSVDEWFDSIKQSLTQLNTDLAKTKSASFLQGLVNELYKNLNFRHKIPELYNSCSDELEKLVVSTSNSVLVVVQQVVKLLRQAEDEKYDLKVKEVPTCAETEEENVFYANWFVKQLRMCSKLLATLRSREMFNKFDSTALSIFSASKDDSTRAAKFATIVLVFIQGYFNLLERVEHIFAELLDSTTQTTYKFSKLLYSLATKGFCSPQPLDEDSEEDAKGDGSGLGDGAGAASSSKDIDDDDENIKEAMQTSNPDQQQHEEDGEEDNAKEVNGDMAGDIEDAPPKDEQDQEEDKNDEDEDDKMCEEMGDLEELDPNAVDEKMWDDQSKDVEEKEKQTDEQFNGSKDDDLQAVEDENVKDEKDQKDDHSDEAGENEENQELDDENVEEDHIGKDEDELLDEGTKQKDILDLPEDMELDSNENESYDEEASLDTDDGMDEDRVDDDDGMGSDAVNEDKDQGGDPESLEGEEIENPEDDTAFENMSAEEEPKHDDNGLTEDSDDIDNPLDQSELQTVNEPELQTEANEGDSQGANIEGLHGPNDEDFAPDKDHATTTENQSNNSGQGGIKDASTEESHVGEGGSLGAKQQPLDNELEDDSNQQSEQVKESLKQLGDAMQQFYRRQQAIQERKERDEQNDEEKICSAEDKSLNSPEELEHVGPENDFDTQALGKSKDNIHQEIDQSMAIDDDMTKSDNESIQEVAGDENLDADRGSGMTDSMPGCDVEEDERDNDKESLQFGEMNRDLEVESESEQDVQAELSLPAQLSKNGEQENPDDLWQHYEAKTHNLALLLGEQLRLILEPAVASKLRGDYRTGKRLNMKRIIPYIASEFRKDKIWLRRTKPAKRDYQILLSLDDSKSMADPVVVDLAFQAITLVGRALTSIETGQIGIAKFGSTTEIVHSLDMPLTHAAGNAVLQQFHFNQQRTDMYELLTKSLQMFSELSRDSGQWKLHIIVSDGITDDHSKLRKLVRQAFDEHVMIVLVVLDALNKGTSILDMNEVRYTTDAQGVSKLEVVKYFEDFPFDYYVIVRNITDLPMVLANVLRQYFQAQQ